MALADVYELRHSGTILGVNWSLVYHVLRANAGFNAETIWSAYASSLMLKTQNVCTADVLFTDGVVRSLGDPLDFYESSHALAGNVGTSETFSPFVASAIRFPRRRTDMHHGYKRYPGVGEDYVSDGVISGVLLTNLATLGSAVITNWEETAAPGVAVCAYVIVKRVLAAGQYRLPQTDGELVYYAPNAYQVQANVSSQNSRKFSG